MNSLISQITERVSSLEQSLRTLEADQAALQTRNAELQGEVQLARREAAELRQRCEVLGRESEEAEKRAAKSRAEADRWRDAYFQLCDRLRAIVDESAPAEHEAQTVEVEFEPIPSEDGEAADATDQPSAPAQTWTIVASPFERFSELRVFQDAIRGMPGTEQVRLIHFDKGTLELSVDYTGEMPIQEALGALESFPGDVSIDSHDRLRFHHRRREDPSDQA